MSRKRPLSPKESGEVGETYEDLLARHPDPTSTPMQLLHSIQSLSSELTPITLWQTERYMVPALSPIAGMRVPREEAIGALRCVEDRLRSRKEAREARFRSMLEKMRAQDAATAQALTGREARRARRREKNLTLRANADNHEA